MRGLQRLGLHGWRLSAQDLEAIAQLPSMKELRLSGCALWALSELPLLTRGRSLAQIELELLSLLGDGDAPKDMSTGELCATVSALLLHAQWRGHAQLNVRGCSAAVVEHVRAFEALLQAFGVADASFTVVDKAWPEKE